MGTLPAAGLYLEKMDLERYRPTEDCALCRVDSFEELLARLRSGAPGGQSCLHWPAWRREAFLAALTAGEWLPPIPALDLPRPGPVGLLELNGNSPTAPVLVTGNSEFTQAVVLAVLSRVLMPLKLLCVDTHGHTVDMALVFQEFHGDRIAQAAAAAGLALDPGVRLILPGLAEAIVPGVEAALGRPVEVGPICAAAIPLYLGPDWCLAETREKS
jgi:hypothetical protein